MYRPWEIRGERILSEEGADAKISSFAHIEIGHRSRREDATSAHLSRSRASAEIVATVRPFDT